MIETIGDLREAIKDFPDDYKFCFMNFNKEYKNWIISIPTKVEVHGGHVNIHSEECLPKFLLFDEKPTQVPTCIKCGYVGCSCNDEVFKGE